MRSGKGLCRSKKMMEKNDCESSPFLGQGLVWECVLVMAKDLVSL